MKTKIDLVFEHLQDKGTITSAQAIELYGYSRLSDAICKFRKMGYDIDTITTSGKDHLGNDVTFATYKLLK